MVNLLNPSAGVRRTVKPPPFSSQVHVLLSHHAMDMVNERSGGAALDARTKLEERAKIALSKLVDFKRGRISRDLQNYPETFVLSFDDKFYEGKQLAFIASKIGRDTLLAKTLRPISRSYVERVENNSRTVDVTYGLESHVLSPKARKVLA